MKDIVNLLEKNINKNLVSIYSYKPKNEEENETFSVGIIENLSNNYVLIHCVDQYGFEDGWMLLSTREIYKVETEDEYLDKMKKICKIRNTKLNNFFDCELSESNNLKYEFLKKIKHLRSLIRFSINSDYHNDIVGRILNINDDILVVSCYDYFNGTFIKEDKFSIENIKRIHCGMKELETIGLLIGEN